MRRFAYLHVQLADRTPLRKATFIVPRVRLASHEMHARLFAHIEIRLSGTPVGIDHIRHCLTSVARHHSPDELGLTTRVYALSGSPVVKSVRRVTIASG